MTALVGLQTMDCLIASPGDGVVRILPEQWSITRTHNSPMRVEISGWLLNSDWQKISKTALASVSMMDLLSEVNRRIKEGENVTAR